MQHAMDIYIFSIEYTTVWQKNIEENWFSKKINPFQKNNLIEKYSKHIFNKVSGT